MDNIIEQKLLEETSSPEVIGNGRHSWRFPVWRWLFCCRSSWPPRYRRSADLRIC